MNLIVTTPKHEIDISNQELQDLKENGGHFFRTFHYKPKVERSDRIYEIENNRIVGYGIVIGLDQIDDSGDLVCETTGRQWGREGDWVVRYNEWRDLEVPIKMKGFQGIRYVENIKESQIKDALLSTPTLQFSDSGGIK